MFGKTEVPLSAVAGIYEGNGTALSVCRSQTPRVYLSVLHVTVDLHETLHLRVRTTQTLRHSGY